MDPISLTDRHELSVYPRRGVVLVRGEGARVWDRDGREYIDCAAGVGVANLGHCQPELTDAVTRQMQRLVTCPNTFYNDVRARLYARLAEIAPAPLVRFYLCNSGAEAIEAAIKFARAATGRTEFICAARGFHGRTCGALSATHNPRYRAPFEPLVPGFHFVRFNHFQHLEQAVNERTAGVLLEIVQGEGGVHLGSHEYFHAVRDLCTRRGALLIIDEIQTGFGRTGKTFASQHYGLRPDLMCVAKALAGGLPMGAVFCSEAIPALIGRHGSTFGGNALCCAAALAAIDYMQAHRLDVQAAEKGKYLLAALRRTPLGQVRQVRGLGLMIGIELHRKVKPILMELLDAGIIALPAGPTVLRLLPPLVITASELDRVIEALRTVLR